MQTARDPEAEQERVQRLEELAAERGPNWDDGFKPGSFGCHELLDRTSMVAGLVDDYLLNHPTCALNPEWFALAWQASAALAELYHRVGATHLDEPGDAPSQTP